MQQEKKQIVFNLKPYQEELLDGLRKGAITHIHMSRRSGKSYMNLRHDGTIHNTTFGSAWDEWEDIFVWPWNPKTSVESGKRIWGRVKVRYNSVVWEANDRQKQYATKKEIFQRKLKGEY